MVGLFLYVGEKPSTYGLPLFVTFVRSDQAVAHFQFLTRVKVLNGDPFESTLKILQMANLCKYNLHMWDFFCTFAPN